MKIFTWMHNKVKVRHGKDQANSTSPNQAESEEFNDWPHSLLAIGTFGNDNFKQDPNRNNLQENPSSSQDPPQYVANEEVKKLQNELTLLLHRQDRGPNSPTELEVPSFTLNETPKGGYRLQDEKTNVILKKGKDICLDNADNAIGKKSILYLLKKTFVCSSGFTPALSIRDQIPESRMEKILREILHKKVYHQSSNPTMPTQKYLVKGCVAKSSNEDEGNEKADDGSKWVRTDSEYIVLEIDMNCFNPTGSRTW
ncbi:hypothetical protein CFOL_v3_08283 [Cephalotus follicularis]|uniref:Uncharacterized protein n=1 Tax=Cephalotus follicularis TaxID=3775 RepID=A0A1Q3B9W5_CEPFO|nr:hypothetical protein CFOL_v3_08283 [Cephalotus follicularis]